MAKRLTKRSRRQALQVVAAPSAEIPLPLLATLQDAEHAFIGLCIDTSKQVLAAMMEQDRIEFCARAGRHDPGREAGRAGSAPSSVVLGGRHIGIGRLRVRSREGSEVSLPSFAAAAASDPLDRHTLKAIASGVSMRRYGRSLEVLPPGESERATSRSTVSRRFVALTVERLAEALAAPLGELDLRVVMIDGIAFRDH